MSSRENLDIPEVIPTHVAIIMDGNGRWANKRGMPRLMGHRKGIDAVKETVRAAADFGIEYLTLFGFSTENWNRPTEEVQELLRLLKIYLLSETSELHKNNVKIRMIGDRSAFPEDIMRLIENAEEMTKNNSKVTVTVALSYGGRFDIVNAVKETCAEILAKGLSPKHITHEMFENHLSTYGMPDPDLLIRTSGERRISNFLLWQCAYAELHVTDTFWPDFCRTDLAEAIDDFNGRERRYGRVAAR
jgi:undecaprenyl diphosphate synthase